MQEEESPPTPLSPAQRIKAHRTCQPESNETERLTGSQARGAAWRQQQTSPTSNQSKPKQVAWALPPPPKGIQLIGSKSPLPPPPTLQWKQDAAAGGPDASLWQDGTYTAADFQLKQVSHCCLRVRRCANLSLASTLLFSERGSHGNALLVH